MCLTGTPIFPENALGSETTASVFGRELHSYVITDAIRDHKVLKFMVDYNDVRPQFARLEAETDEQKLSAAENRQALLHPTRIHEISDYILNHFAQKTHRTAGRGFNAMFAVSSVEAAKLYYEELQKLQEKSEKKLTIATIFSFAANESQNAIGDIEDETFEPTALDYSAKEFLTRTINDYNKKFNGSFSVEGKSFQNYYKDLAKRVKNKEVDLLIVVGMFLTGFDAPTLNTLFVDKNLQYHGLIQAFSRTNRIYDATKSFGNIVTFRDLESKTKAAITLFGKSQTAEVLLERPYNEYMNGFKDDETDEARRGYLEVVHELKEKFPEPDKIVKEADKKQFVKLFGEFLKLDNILQNYDEFAGLQALQEIDLSDEQAVEALKAKFYLDDEKIQELEQLEIPNVREIQDHRSTYNDIREWYTNERRNQKQEESTVDWDTVTFEVELLKSQEINLDYILELIFETNKKVSDKDQLIDEIIRTIRASVGNRAKESLIVDFIRNTNINAIKNRPEILEKFYAFAQKEQQKEMRKLIEEEGLNESNAKRYIKTSLKREYASENGNELNETLPKMSPLNPAYHTKKQTVFEKISAFVEKFKGIGG